jgi:hypothetical protein
MGVGGESAAICELGGSEMIEFEWRARSTTNQRHHIISFGPINLLERISLSGVSIFAVRSSVRVGCLTFSTPRHRQQGSALFSR